MSWASKEMLDVMWHLAAVGTDVEPRSLQYPDLNCARVAHSFLVRSFSESLIGCGRSSNTIFFSDL